MEKIIFKVSGGAPDPYKVTFIKNENNINAYCTCPAGKNGRYCKHRLAILAGEDQAIVSLNRDQVMVVRSWLPGSELEKALVELAEAEHEYDKAKKHLTIAKKNITQLMRK